MKIEIKKIIRPLDLGGYASEYQGQAVQVWVNPTLAVLDERDEIVQPYAAWVDMLKDNPTRVGDFDAYVTEQFAPQINGWFARLWSQAEDIASHWTVDEITIMQAHDPALLEWLKRHSMRLIAEHRSAEKKT
jgi:hypothetical protein